MKTNELKSIKKRYTNGKSGKTWFEIRKIDEKNKRIYWWCTHGAWELITDLQGKYVPGENIASEVDIEEVFVKDEYMYLFGNQNRHE